MKAQMKLIANKLNIIYLFRNRRNKNLYSLELILLIYYYLSLIINDIDKKLDRYIIREIYSKEKIFFLKALMILYPVKNLLYFPKEKKLRLLILKKLKEKFFSHI